MTVQIKALNYIKPDDFALVDDGSLDTVVQFRGDTFRFSDTSDYREMDGSLNWCEFLEDNADYILDDWHEAHCTYDNSAALQDEIDARFNKE